MNLAQRIFYRCFSKFNFLFLSILVLLLLSQLDFWNYTNLYTNTNKEVIKNLKTIPNYFENDKEKTREISLSLFNQVSKSSLKELKSKFHSPSFLKRISNFPLEAYSKAQEEKNNEKITSFSVSMINALTEYLILEPLITINTTCKAPSLPKLNTLLCPFNKEKRLKPAKLGHILMFGFDVDILEIHLQEIYDLVDYIFIIESTRSHQKQIRKPLIWEAIRTQKRFLPFDNKIIHLVVDDVESKSNLINNTENYWYLQDLEENIRWKRFLLWNSKTNYFNKDDLIGFSDTDEIISRETLQLLKYCNLSDPIDIQLSSYKMKLNEYKKEQSYDVQIPTYWPLEIAMKITRPSKRKEKSYNTLLGGIHLLNHQYLPYILIKQLTKTGGEGISIERLLKHLKEGIKEKSILKFEKHYTNIDMINSRRKMRNKEKNSLEENSNLQFIPWFYNCNKERYPYLEGKHDTRLGD